MSDTSCQSARKSHCWEPILFSSCRRRAAGSPLPYMPTLPRQLACATTEGLQQTRTCVVEVCEVPEEPEPSEATSTSSPHCQPHLLCPSLPLTCQGQKALQDGAHSQVDQGGRVWQTAAAPHL